MKYLFLLLLTACTALGQTATLTRPDRSKLFYPENYGGADDRAKIQAAMDAAEATGGTVMLAPKTYSITTVNSPASGNKAAGAYGLEIPSNVALVGSGPNTVLSIVSGGAYGVGVGISPKGMRTATANFGAASKVLLQDFSISAATQAESNGNLLNIVHASDWIVRRVRIGGCYFHGVELDQSRRILFEDCTWTGAYTGISGSWIQLDYGLAGPVNRPAGITTRAVEDITFLRCRGEQRTAGESAAARDIEITHATTELVVTRVSFIECEFTGRNEQAVAIVDIAGTNTSGSVSELLFKDCKFITTHPKAFAFSMVQASGMTFRGIRFRGCEFRGPSASFVVMGGSTSATYNATHSLRWEGEISNCRFLFDKSQMPVSLDVNLVIANAWSSFTFADNYIEATGDFPVSVGLNYCRLLLCNNNLLTRVMRNSANWAGTGSFAVGATGFIVDISLADVAGTTRGLYVQDNVLYSTAGTGWSYGILVTTGTTFPANRAVQYTGNHGNLANTATNNIVAAGGTVGGSITSGGVGSALRDTTASTTLTAADFILNCNTASGSITVTPASVLGRRCYILIKTNASNSLICGSTTVTDLGAGILVYTDGTTTFTKSF